MPKKAAGPVASKRIGRDYGGELWERLENYRKKAEMRGPWAYDADAREEAQFQGCDVAVFVAAAKAYWLKCQREWLKEQDV